MDFTHNSYIYRKKYLKVIHSRERYNYLKKKKKKERVKLKTSGSSCNYVVSIPCETNAPEGNLSKMIDLSKSIVKLQEPYKCPKSNPIWLVMENAGHYCLMFKLAYITLSHKSGNSTITVQMFSHNEYYFICPQSLTNFNFFVTPYQKPFYTKNSWEKPS